MKSIIYSLFILSSALVFSKTTHFDFKDPKGVNSILFHLDAPLESISGSGNDISGSVHFDPKKPEDIRGEIILKTESLHVGNPVLKEHMHGEDWLSAGKFPDIKLVFNSMTNIKRDGVHIFKRDGAHIFKNDGVHISGEINGKMTIRNITLAMSIPVKISYLEGLLEKRNRVPGDLLVVRSKFTVKRDDFDIQKGEHLEKVSNDIEIILNLAGSAPTQ